ncbi:hypothetical protein GGI12_004870 [Dipsacomyces acuminosporus]|nr:hypothetical protein GGI12_004870 [Dipsacomyces acuminosporus]
MQVDSSSTQHPASDKPCSTAPSLSVEVLKDSFEMLVESYPILQSHVEGPAGARALHINEDDLKKQLFVSHTEPRLSFEEFQEIKYRRDLWPGALRSMLDGVLKPNAHNLASAIVVRFSNGWMATLNVSHLLVDVTGAFILLEQWASLSKYGKLKRGLENEKTFLNIFHNARYLIGGSSDYIGNCISPMPITIDSDEIESMPIVELAKHIKSHIRTLTRGAVAHLVKELANPDTDFYLLNAMITSKPESRLVLSNVSRLPFFDIDFGFGTPEAALWGNDDLGDTTIWMPLKDGGIDIYLGIDEDMLAFFAKDQVITEYCEIVSM